MEYISVPSANADNPVSAPVEQDKLIAYIQKKVTSDGQGISIVDRDVFLGSDPQIGLDSIFQQLGPWLEYLKQFRMSTGFALRTLSTKKVFRGTNGGFASNSTFEGTSLSTLESGEAFEIMLNAVTTTMTSLMSIASYLSIVGAETMRMFVGSGTWLADPTLNPAAATFDEYIVSEFHYMRDGMCIPAGTQVQNRVAAPDHPSASIINKIQVRRTLGNLVILQSGRTNYHRTRYYSKEAMDHMKEDLSDSWPGTYTKFDVGTCTPDATGGQYAIGPWSSRLPGSQLLNLEDRMSSMGKNFPYTPSKISPMSTQKIKTTTGIGSFKKSHPASSVLSIHADWLTINPYATGYSLSYGNKTTIKDIALVNKKNFWKIAPSDVVLSHTLSVRLVSAGSVKTPMTHVTTAPVTVSGSVVSGGDVNSIDLVYDMIMLDNAITNMTSKGRTYDPIIYVNEIAGPRVNKGGTSLNISLNPQTLPTPSFTVLSQQCNMEEDSWMEGESRQAYGQTTVRPVWEKNQTMLPDGAPYGFIDTTIIPGLIAADQQLNTKLYPPTNNGVEALYGESLNSLIDVLDPKTLHCQETCTGFNTYTRQLVSSVTMFVMASTLQDPISAKAAQMAHVAPLSGCNGAGSFTIPLLIDPCGSKPNHVLPNGINTLRAQTMSINLMTEEHIGDLEADAKFTIEQDYINFNVASGGGNNVVFG